MRIKAEYKTMYGRHCWKYFHNVEEMKSFFAHYIMCKYISHEEGDAVEAEARSLGFE